MLVPKTSLLQVRVEPELLERFRRISEEGYRQTVSAAMRDLMIQACDSYERRQSHLARDK